jgi:hypothetical protein
MNADDVTRLEADARYARERLKLYTARVHGPRPTDRSRLRDLESVCRRAETRLRRARTVPSNN